MEPVKGSVQTPEPESAPLHSVDAYLQQIPVFRTEINLVSQFMKLPAIKYYRFRYNDRYYVRSEFKIRGYWTYYKPLEFYGEGWSPIYRQACEHAAYQVLRVLFMYCPELWHKFIELKKRRGFQWFLRMNNSINITYLAQHYNIRSYNNKTSSIEIFPN